MSTADSPKHSSAVHQAATFPQCLTLLQQKEEWSAADDTFKLHKSKLEVAKEEAAAVR